MKRKRPRPLLRKADRVFWVIPSCLWPGWRHALVIVRPETVIGWHRKGQAFLDMEVAAGKTGPTTGVEGDPLSGPTDVAGEHTVGRTSDPCRAFETWLFHLPGRRLEIHGPLPIAAIEVVADIPYKSRRLPGVDRFLRGPHGHVPPPVRVHRAPPRAPPDRAFRCHGEPDDGVGRTADPRAIPVGHGAARYLIRDRDGAYGQSFRSTVTAMGVEEVVTAPRSPWQNPYVERLIGSVRGECLDHSIILNERHLRRILGSYLDYYHGSRTHLSIGKDTPDGRPVQPAGPGTVVSLPKVGGLHHRYERHAA